MNGKRHIKVLSHGSSVLRLIKRAMEYHITDQVMLRLNYYDLQAMIIEYDIHAQEQKLSQKESDRLSSRGIEKRHIASNSELLALHGIG